MTTSQLNSMLKAFVIVMLAIFGLCPLGLGQEVSLAALQPPVGAPVVGGSLPSAPGPSQPNLGVSASRPPEATALEATPMTNAFVSVTPREIPSQHRFWDRENALLFATSTALSAADFVVTRDNLREGGRELNPVTRLFSGSTAGLAVNFAGESAGVVGLSYVFHKTGHHRLERLVSMVNISSSAAAVSFDLAHR